MNTYLLLVAAALSAQPQLEESISVYKLSEDFAAVVRGQTPGYDEIPSPGSTPAGGVPPTYAPPASGGGLINPFQPAPLVQDPFLGQPGLGVGGQPGNFAFGANGPQPYRFGWTFRQDAGFLPKVSTQGNLGDFGVTEFDTDLEYTTAVSGGWIFSFTQQYNLRLWDGPASLTPTAIGLPGSVHRIGWDFEMATPANQPWSFQLAFNPSVNSDFESGTSSDAWNLDARAIAFYRASPHWMFAFGAGYWDRVNSRIVPYAGAVWTPDDRWEWRLVFPKPRVSYYLGTPFGVPKWVYVTGEYHVEAYEIDVARAMTGTTRDRIELEDWRLMIGTRNEATRFTSFLETGWVFGRKVEFSRTPGFNISSGFIVRGGIQF